MLPELEVARRIAQAAQGRRDVVRRVVGRALVKDIGAISGTDAKDPFPIRLHPATTAGDLTWLNLEISRAFLAVVSFAGSLDLDDGRSIRRLRGRVEELLGALRMVRLVAAALERFDDEGIVGSPSPLVAARAALNAVTDAAGSLLGSIIASSPTEATEANASFEGAIRALDEIIGQLDSVDPNPVDLRETLEVAFAAALDEDIDSLEGAVATFRGLDPSAPGNDVASPIIFSAPAEGAVPTDADNLVRFAERQLRYIGIPSPPLDLRTSIDLFQLAFRLPTLPCPTLAHLVATHTSFLLIEANEADSTATQARLEAFQAEDAPGMRQRAARADRAAEDSNVLERVTGFRRLAEGVCRPWVRLLLDLHDIAAGRSARRLAPGVYVSDVFDQAAHAAQERELLAFLVGPFDADLRNADAHEQLELDLSGSVQLFDRDGTPGRRYSLDELVGRYGVLRSAFLGIDTAQTVFLYGWRLGLPEGAELRLTPEVLDMVVRMFSMTAAQPPVEALEIRGRTLLITSNESWTPQGLADLCVFLSRVVNGQHDEVEFVVGDRRERLSLDP